MAPSIWKLSIRPTDAGAVSSSREVTVEADSWQAALVAGRAQLGERGPMPADATSFVSASGEVTLVDPTNQQRYVLVPAAPDNAQTPIPRGAPAPSSARPHHAPGASASAPRATSPEIAGPSPSRTASSRPPGAPRKSSSEPAGPVATRTPSSGLPSTGAARTASSRPPPSGTSRTSSSLPPSPSTPPASLPPIPQALVRAQQTLPYSPERAAALEREFAAAHHGSSSRPPPADPRGNLRAVPGDTAAASTEESGARTATQADPLTLLASRDVERSDENTLTYRERAYLLESGADAARAGGTAQPDRDQLEQLLHRKLATLQAELAGRPRGKYVTLALFDQAPDAGTQREPIATLEWKDWRGAPTFALAGEAPFQDSAVRAPSGAPPAPRPLQVDSTEADTRLASAFESMHDLHFAATPLAALELAIALLDRLVPCDALSGALYDLDTHEFRFVTLRGPGAEERRASAVPADEGLLAGALTSGDEVVVTHHAARDPRFDAAIDGRLGLEAHELAYVPLRQHGQVFGMLQLINRSAREESNFDEADVAVLSYVAGQLSRFFADRRGGSSE